jgi:hypothetical protein
MPLVELLIPVTLFLCTTAILYIFFTTRHKERMSMIEKGADPALFQTRRDGRYVSMRIGMFLIGIALGILAGNVLAVSTRLIEEVAYFSMIFLFGGLSLISYYFFVDRNRKNHPE